MSQSKILIAAATILAVGVVGYFVTLNNQAHSPDSSIGDKEPQMVLLTRLTGSRLNAVQPSWSPDGKWIAFTGDTLPPRLMVEPRPSDIYVMDAEGKNLKKLAVGQYYGRPQWSSDSSRIYFRSYSKDEAVWCWDILEKQSCTATDEEVKSLPDRSVSSDGSMRVFTEGLVANDPMSIWIEDIVSGEKVQVTAVEKDTNISGVTWNPDGEWIAYTYQKWADDKLYVRAVSPRTKDVLVLSEGWGPDWSPDGRYIALSKNRSIYLYPWGGSTAKSR